jgi:MHS family proline/betaine transporter-like MFS transporter
MYLLTDVSYKTEIPSEKNITTSTRISSSQDSVSIKMTTLVFDDGSNVIETTTTTKKQQGQTTVDSKKEIKLNGEPYYAMIGLILVQLVLVTMVYGPIAAFLVELFPTRIRYTSMSLPYHIGNGIFGGLTPLLATSLFEFSKTESNPAGDPLAGLWYPIIVAGITFIVGN